MVFCKNELSGTEKPIDKREMEHVEHQFGFKFPEEIRNHFLKYNGGCPDRYVFQKSDVFYVIQNFLPIKYGNPATLFEITYEDIKIKQKILPEHLVPFAIDPGGDYYCFSLDQKDIGSIFIFRGEYADESNRSTQYLSPNLSNFIESMVEDE